MVNGVFYRISNKEKGSSAMRIVFSSDWRR